MRAKTLNENMEFQRGKGSKKSLGVGMTPEKWYHVILEKISSFTDNIYAANPNDTMPGGSIEIFGIPEIQSLDVNYYPRIETPWYLSITGRDPDWNLEGNYKFEDPLELMKKMDEIIKLVLNYSVERDKKIFENSKKVRDDWMIKIENSNESL